jgi:hypothetical protein
MSNLVNRFPIDPATGKVLATLNAPLPIWGENGGWSYDPVTDALAMIDAVPAASDPWLGGLRFNPAGSMYVWTAASPAQVFVLGGLPVTFDGRLIVNGSGPIVGYSNGLPMTAGGGMAVSGLVPTDPYWAFVQLLLHFEGTNGSTVITDVSSSPKSVVASGSSAISTARFKFGASSLLGGATGFITAAMGAGGSMTGDFTWESWLWGGNNNVVFYSTVPGAYLYNDVFTGYGGPDLAVIVNFSAAWHHVAISRVGSTIRGFTDGALTGTQTYAGTVDLTNLVMGKYVPNGNLFFVDNYDDIRITKGVGRYTTAFTPPTAQFPDS